MSPLIVIFLFAGLIIGGEMQQGKVQPILGVGPVICEGKDAANYTLIATATLDALCGGSVGPPQSYLIKNSPNGQKTVNTFKQLASSVYPAGDLLIIEVLSLVTSGNLEGNFLYLKEITRSFSYLKKCSSVLGLSYILTNSQDLWIADKLDPNIFVNPLGALASIKGKALTRCQGWHRNF